MALAIVNKLLHVPTVRLKESAASGDGTLAGAVAELFAIDAESGGGAERPARASQGGQPDAGPGRAAAASSDRN
jgi:hypothetical protein